MEDSGFALTASLHPHQDVYAFDATAVPEQLLDEHFAHEACRSRY